MWTFSEYSDPMLLIDIFSSSNHNLHTIDVRSRVFCLKKSMMLENISCNIKIPWRLQLNACEHESYPKIVSHQSWGDYHNLLRNPLK